MLIDIMPVFGNREFLPKGAKLMYMLKVCHCCDAIIGELDEHALSNAKDVEIRGNVAYSLCSRCMGDLSREHNHNYFQ